MDIAGWITSALLLMLLVVRGWGWRKKYNACTKTNEELFQTAVYERSMKNTYRDRLDEKKFFAITGEEIKNRRLKTGMSQGEFARRAGISSAYMCQLETSVRNPSIKTVKKLAQTFKEIEQWEKYGNEQNNMR